MKEIQIKEIMSKNIITINIDDTIVNASKIMAEKNIGFLPVVEKNILKGVITDRDIVCKIINTNTNIFSKVSCAMTTKVITVDIKERFSIAITKMADNQIRRLIVLDNAKLVGIISISDIINYTNAEIYFTELMKEILMPNSCTLLKEIKTDSILV